MKKIAIIGMGYVGLPLALRFAESNCKVIGVDIDREKVRLLNNGDSYILHIQPEKIKDAVKYGSFKATYDFSEIRQCDAVIICVPTPLNKNREPDISYIIETAKSIAPYLQKGTLISLESTTYPGTTDTDLKNILEERSKLIAGKDFYLAFSPEREDPGNEKSNVAKIPKIVGGLTENCLEKAQEIYSLAVDKLVPVSSCRVAEATKLMENIFRAVNVALVNELKVVYNKMGIDIWDVIKAASSKPFGYMPFYPGPGLGGHCIPIDPFYLTWKAREYGMNTKLIELAGEINSSMPEYVIAKVNDALNDYGKPIRGSRVLVVGLAYKADVNDIRESPSLTIIEKLRDRGAIVSYNDPFVQTIPKTREHGSLAGMQSQPLSNQYDCLVICTGHSLYRDEVISALHIPVVDTRRVMKPAINVYQA